MEICPLIRLDILYVISTKSHDTMLHTTQKEKYNFSFIRREIKGTQITRVPYLYKGTGLFF